MNTKPMKKEYYIYKSTVGNFGNGGNGFRIPGTYSNKKVAYEVMRLTIKVLPEDRYTVYWVDFDWIN